LYFQGNLGAAWGRLSDRNPGPEFAGESRVEASDPKGSFIVGGELGYVWQAGLLVFGASVDAQSATGFGFATVGTSQYRTYDVDALAAFRGRVGIVAGPFLLYAAAGLGFAHAEEKIWYAGIRGPVSDGTIRVGWSAGVGVQTPIATGLGLSLEYLHLSFPGNANELDVHLLRAGFQIDPGALLRRKLSDRPAQLYVGAGVSYAHHTGHHRPASDVDVEEWHTGSKVFGGVRLASWAACEATYHYFGTIESQRGNIQSQAATVTVLAFSDPLLEWLDRPRYVPPVRLFARGGAGAKFINAGNSSTAAATDSGVVFHIAGGAEAAISDRAFVRIEYEFLSQPRTDRVPDLMHSPVSLSAGVQF
jgi:opacity protein-like surface antigen